MHKKEKMNTYKARLDNALSNTFLRQAMDAFALGYKSSRKKAFAGMDKEQMICDVAEIKAHALAENTQLLETFSAKARALGIHVHPAATGREANQLIAQIAKDTGSRHIVKSKSMTAEEIQLNPWLESQGLEVTETDLGEWIVQLRKEGPSHMVLPAIHLSKLQVADLFSKVTGKEQAPQIQDLVKVARKELRQKFVKADMGITGANYLIAETGSVGFVTNEGNARLVTTLPRVHVVLAGIEKVLPTLYEALAVNQVLPRNATGQAITSYVTWITGPLESRSGDRNAP